MSCYHPLYSYWRTLEDGSRDKVFANNHDLPFIQKDGHIFSEKIELPCGQCIGCRLDYSRQWATRCVLEAQQWQHNYFVTLTYNDWHVPYNKFQYVDYFTGDVCDDFTFTLLPEDLQKFMKRLRINLKRKFGFPSDYVYDSNGDIVLDEFGKPIAPPGVRFYACGEYGSTTARPHYHLCLFNCPLPDLEAVANNFRGDVYYESAFLNDIWSDKFGPIGYVSVADLSYDCCAYVARYMTKKHKGKDASYYDEHHIAPEFSRMSRKPGIARSYFDANSGKIYAFDEIIITGSDGKAKKVRPPRYYDMLYDISSPEDMKRVKVKRISSGKLARKQIENRTSLSRIEYLSVCEGNQLSKIKSLNRSKL